MEHIIIQLVTAFFGTLGFSLIFQVPRKDLFWTALGGLLDWGTYLFLHDVLGGEFLPYLFTSMIAAVYAETMARIHKTPATTFLVPALIPSVPGGALFYTMSSVVSRDWTTALEMGYATLQYALGISGGISIIWALGVIVRRVFEE